MSQGPWLAGAALPGPVAAAEGVGAPHPMAPPAPPSPRPVPPPAPPPPEVSVQPPADNTPAPQRPSVATSAASAIPFPDIFIPIELHLSSSTCGPRTPWIHPTIR